MAIATEIPPELVEEGIARELVHRLQTMRRSAGFDIADRIATYYQSGASIQQVMKRFASYIEQETLSMELIEGAPGPDAHVESHRIGGEEVVLGAKRLASPAS